MAQKMTNAEILVKNFQDLNVTHVFGYPGAAILPVFHALAKSPINIMVNSNEQSCAFSASGYSRSSDKVGIAITTSGPAITNTLTAVADSFADSIPLLVFAGQVPQKKLVTDEFQQINVTEVFAKAAKKVILITDNSNIETVVKDSYFYAKSGKPGPVVIDFPLDMQRKIGLSEIKVCVKGGGDLASGVAWRLYQCGFRVYMTEIDQPMAVRRKVAFCDAVYHGSTVVEGVEALLVHKTDEVFSLWVQEKIPILVDPKCKTCNVIRPDVLVDERVFPDKLGWMVGAGPIHQVIGPIHDHLLGPPRFLQREGLHARLLHESAQ